MQGQVKSKWTNPALPTAQPKFQMYTMAGYNFEEGGWYQLALAVFSAFVDRFSKEKEENNFFAIMSDFHVWMPLSDSQ